MNAYRVEPENMLSQETGEDAPLKRFFSNMGLFVSEKLYAFSLLLIPIALWSGFHFYLHPSIKPSLPIPWQLFTLLLGPILIFIALLLRAAFQEVWIAAARSFRFCLLYSCVSVGYQLLQLYRKDAPFVSFQVWLEPAYRAKIFPKVYTYILAFDLKSVALVLFGLTLVRYSYPIFKKLRGFVKVQPLTHCTVKTKR